MAPPLTTVGGCREARSVLFSARTACGSRTRRASPAQPDTKGPFTTTPTRRPMHGPCANRFLRGMRQPAQTPPRVYVKPAGRAPAQYRIPEGASRAAHSGRCQRKAPLDMSLRVIRTPLAVCGDPGHALRLIAEILIPVSRYPQKSRLFGLATRIPTARPIPIPHPARSAI